MLKYYILSAVLFVSMAYCEDIKVIEKTLKDELLGYYEGPDYTAFKEDWDKYEDSYNRVIERGLQENYASAALNVYVKQGKNPRKISNGFLVSDDVVHVLFGEMNIRDWPILTMLDTKLKLADRVLDFRAVLGQFMIDAPYVTFRNNTDLNFPERDEDALKFSPFTFHRVQTKGRVAIVADDCIVKGFASVSLNGDTVAMGANNISVSSCSFTIEISTPGMGSPPVIAPYFKKQQRAVLCNALSGPIKAELLPKLQGILYSYINTSSLFGTNNLKYRNDQIRGSLIAAKYYAQLASNFNRLVIEKISGQVNMADFSVRLQATHSRRLKALNVAMTQITINGLDSVYSGNTGGPGRINRLVIMGETFTYSNLQIRGKFSVGDDYATNVYDFGVELSDVTVLVQYNDVHKSDSFMKPVIEFSGWRSIDFSVMPLLDIFENKITFEALITGYIMNELPHYVKLSKYIVEASGYINMHNKDIEKIQLNSNEQNYGPDIDQSDEHLDKEENDIPGPKGDVLESMSDDDTTNKKPFFSGEDNKKPFFSHKDHREPFFSDKEFSKSFFADLKDKEDKEISGDNLPSDNGNYLSKENSQGELSLPGPNDPGPNPDDDANPDDNLKNYNNDDINNNSGQIKSVLTPDNLVMKKKLLSLDKEDPKPLISNSDGKKPFFGESLLGSFGDRKSGRGRALVKITKLSSQKKALHKKARPQALRTSKSEIKSKVNKLQKAKVSKIKQKHSRKIQKSSSNVKQNAKVSAITVNVQSGPITRKKKTSI